MTAPAPRTVLLLHAYPLSAAMWDDQRAALEAEGFRVIAPNLPGFGGEEGAITTLEDAARDLLGTLPEGDPLAVVGLSMGGYLAMELLRQAPDRFARVVLADTSLRADDPEKAQDRRDQADRVEDEGRDFILHAAEKEHAPATFRRVRLMIESATREGIAGALRAMAVRGEHRDTLRGLEVPLLVLVGEQDQITPVELAQEIADAGRGELRVLPGAAHLSNLDNPDAFNGALLAFLR